ncbi:hypothetical protein E6H36_07185 [Candidatus Bathyarchaeota archaeon]|nr:MAG: hypothetical protein E6H36_07185 [Candidatus Bathyarchaeota archaeon]
MKGDVGELKFRKVVLVDKPLGPVFQLSGWARRRFEEAKERASQGKVELDEYDRRIVESTRQLCVQLRIPATVYNPYRVEWTNRVTFKGEVSLDVVLADSCSFEPSLVILEKKAQGVLDADEWKALIAPELAYKFVAIKKGHRRFVLRIVLPVVSGFGSLGVLLSLLLFPVLTKYGDAGELGLLALFLGISFAAIVTVARLSLPGDGRARLVADKMAAELVGRDKLIQALQKAETTLDSREKDKHRHVRVNRPSEKERIERLLETQGHGRAEE